MPDLAASKPLLVLLVEDDPDLRDALCDALVECGHTVITAADGADGLRQLRRTHPDVVVLDLMMPELDGWQFRIAQRDDPMIASTPVVAISASNSATAAAVDADLFLRKPLDGETLCRAIEDVVAANAKRSEPAKAAQADRLATLGTLAAGLAQEINNPLTYVLLQLANVVRLLPELEHDRNRARIQEILDLARGAMEGAERIRGIMGAIRTFSRFDDTTKSPLDVRVPLDAALRLVGNELRHRARLVKDYAEAPMVLANEGRLGQVFLNVLANALQALPEGPADSHEVCVRLGSDAAGDLVVEISDTGVGIPPHVIGKVFEPYFSTKPVGQGTGLGLAITRDIITAHGGSIGVTSGPERGTTFRIVLPAHRRRNDAHPAA